MIVADDANLEIAEEFGFIGIDQTNEYVGRKFNDGIEYACRALEADYVVLIGSDDWMHIDLFDRLPQDETTEKWPTDDEPFVTWSPDTPEVITGREIALVDLETGRLQRCRARGRHGVIPWILPRKALEPSGFRPIRDDLNIGIDGSLIAGLNVAPEWVFSDPHDLCRVDFKSAVNLNSYEKITRAIGDDVELPLSLLRHRYPLHLIEMAEETAGLVAA